MKQIKLMLIFFAVIITVNAYGITGEEAIEKFRSRMYGIQKLTGVITWTYQSGLTVSGSFKYMAPDRIYVKFSTPPGKVIVSNGQRLWVYNQNTGICGIQDLAEGVFSGGIAAIVSGEYKAIASGGQGGYTIRMKNEEREYSEITLRVDSTFFLQKAIIRTKDGGVFSFSLSNVSWKAAVLPTIFNFSVPTSAQIVKNPLNMD